MHYNAAPMRHSSIWLYAHVIFSTKNRRPLIGKKVQENLWAYMGGIARKNDVRALKIGGTANHAPMLLLLPSIVPIGEAVREIKAGSSLWFRERHDRLFSWQEGFGAFSVSASHVAQVTRYIENQERHHRKMSSADEWRLLVEKYSMAIEKD